MVPANSAVMHEEPAMTFYWRNARWLLLSVVVFVLDQWTKNLVVAHFSYREILPVFAAGERAGFNLVLAHNYGAAFSFLANQPGWQRWFFAGIALVVSVGLTVWLLRLPMQNRWLLLSLSLLVGGAVGNLYDRALLGYVVDFLDFWYAGYHWPAFNVADSAICVGAAVLLLEQWLDGSKLEQRA
jgi:signal peptidase II